ncbi:MAG: VacJ family lipoprotein [Geminicoccaceae bacterium]|nr:VacJ family lipoprotein [Geminicoccaceae bacterium]
MSKNKGPRFRPALAGVLSAALLAAVPVGAEEVHDPLEPINRTIYGLNELFDVMLLGPVAQTYGELPRPLRTGVRNVLDNLRSPVTFVNDLLQGEFDRAGVTFARMFINSTIGIFGLFDLASEFGYPPHEEDFGQTLAVWGVGEGPFLMLPLLGPSTVRDAAGFVVDRAAFDPLARLGDTDIGAVRAIGETIDTRHRLDPVIRDLRRNSLDPYAAVRSAYLQRRAAEIRNRRPPAGERGYEAIFREEGDDDDAAAR